MGYASGPPRMVRLSQVVNAGSSTALREKVTPVVDTTSGKWVFQHAQRPVRLQNVTGQTLFILVNDTKAKMIAETPSSATTLNFSRVLATGAVLDLSEGGAINVKTVSIWFPAGATLASAVFHWFE